MVTSRSDGEIFTNECWRASANRRVHLIEDELEALEEEYNGGLASDGWVVVRAARLLARLMILQAEDH